MSCDNLNNRLQSTYLSKSIENQMENCIVCTLTGMGEIMMDQTCILFIHFCSTQSFINHNGIKHLQKLNDLQTY